MIAAIVLFSFATPQTTWYVDATGVAPGTGTQTDPYTRVDYAVAQPTTLSGDTILVAPKVYRDEAIDLGSKSLQLIGDGAALVGAPSFGPTARSVITIDGSVPGSTVIEGFTFTGETGTPISPGVHAGSAIHVVGDDPIIRNCLFLQCGVLPGPGAGVALGGAVYIEGNSEPVWIEDCSFRLNRAGSRGGACHVQNGVATFRNCDFDRNGSFLQGGHLSASASTIVVEACSLMDPQHLQGTSVHGGQGEFDSCTVAVSGSSIGYTQPTSSLFGGFRFFSCSLTVSNSTFYGNVSSEPGGALRLSSGNAHIVNSLFQDNRSDAGISPGLVAGGAIFSDASQGLELEQCSFLRNEAPFGGALYVSAGSLRMENCQYSDNVAMSGGAVHAASTVNVKRCRFEANRCELGPAFFIGPISGGGMTVEGGGFICDSTFIGNTLSQTNPALGTPRGAGLYALSPIAVSRCIFQNNEVIDLSANGIAWAGPVTAEHCTVVGNQSPMGGSFVSGGQVLDSILHGHPFLSIDPATSIRYSLVEGGTPGSGNFDADPLFWSLTDLELQPGSAAIDAGDPLSPRDPDGTRTDVGAKTFRPEFCGLHCFGPIGVDSCSGNPNSTGLPSQLKALGRFEVGENLLVLHANQLPIGVFGYFITSRTSDFVPGFNGSDGNLCLGAPFLGRFNNVVMNSREAGEFVQRLDLTVFPQAQAVQSGETWFFQAWHRDRNSTTSTSNTTPAVSVTFL